MPLARTVALAALAACLPALAACGGGDVPSDFESVSELGTTFSVPPGMRANAPTEVDDSTSISYIGDGVTVQIRRAAGRGDAFDTYPSQLKAVTTAFGEGEIDGQESRDVEGAQEGFVLSGTQQGEGGRTVDFVTVGARKDEDVYVLTARAFEDGDVDPAAIADSLRIDG